MIPTLLAFTATFVMGFTLGLLVAMFYLAVSKKEDV